MTLKAQTVIEGERGAQVKGEKRPGKVGDSPREKGKKTVKNILSKANWAVELGVPGSSPHEEDG